MTGANPRHMHTGGNELRGSTPCSNLVANGYAALVASTRPRPPPVPGSRFPSPMWPPCNGHVLQRDGLSFRPTGNPETEPIAALLGDHPRQRRSTSPRSTGNPETEPIATLPGDHLRQRTGTSTSPTGNPETEPIATLPGDHPWQRTST